MGGPAGQIDAGVFSEFLAPCLPKSFKIAVAILGDAHEAQDAVQEAAFAAFRSVNELSNPNAFPAWFQRIVVRKAIDFLRKRTRDRKRTNACCEDMVVRSQTTSLDTEAVILIREAVDRLPVNHRVVIRLYYGMDHTTPEIANMMGKPEGTIRRLLSEAYKMLRPVLRSVWYEEKGEKATVSLSGGQRVST